MYRTFSSQQNAENAIASFGIAYNLVLYLQAFTMGLCNVSILVVWSKNDLSKTIMISFGICLTLVSFSAFIGLTDIGEWIFHQAFTISPATAKSTKYIFFILSCTLFFEGIFQVLWGQFIQHKHTLFVAQCNVILGVVQVIAIFITIRSSIFQNSIFLIPILSIYLGYAAALVVTSIGFLHKIWNVLPQSSRSTVTIQRFLKFYAPLTIVFNGWLICFPLAKAIMTNTTQGSTGYITQQLAITSVIIPATRLLLDGLQNVIEVTVLTFGQISNEYTTADFAKLTAFYTGLSFLLVLIFVWIPPVQKWYLELFLNLPPSLLEKVSTPLKIQTAYVIVQGAQHLFIGNLLLKEATGMILIGTVIRVVFLIGALYILAYCFHVGGAIQVAIAVMFCISAETVVLGVLDFFQEKKLTPGNKEKYFQCPPFPQVNFRESRIQTESLDGNYNVNSNDFGFYKT